MPEQGAPEWRKWRVMAGSKDRKSPGGPTPAPKAGSGPEPFWRKPLEAMTRAEWESLCDGCGRCCLVKLEDEDTGDIHFTGIGCRLLEASSCRCGDYPNRKAKVPDCVKLTPKRVRDISWLPPTCAYRLVGEGKDLYWWHHLKSGSRETVHEAGVSVRGRVAGSEDDVPFDNVLDYIVEWPGRVPKKSLKPPKKK